MSSTDPAFAEEEIDLRPYLEILWRRRHIVIAVALAAAVVGFLLSYIMSPVYESQVLIQISEHSAPIYSTPSAAAQVITAPSFVKQAVGPLDLPESPRYRTDLVRVESVRDTRMIRLRVRYSDARQAQRVADAIANHFLSRAAERVEQRRTTTVRRLESVNAQLAKIDVILELSRKTLSRIQSGTLTPADRGLFQSFTLNAMGISEALYSGLRAAQKDLTAELLILEPATVVESPTFPLDPVAPRKGMNAVLGGVLGLLAGTIAVFVVEHFQASPQSLSSSPALTMSPNPPRPEQP